MEVASEEDAGLDNALCVGRPAPPPLEEPAPERDVLLTATSTQCAVLLKRRRLPVMFRTFRCTGVDMSNGEYISTTPDPQYMHMHGIFESVLIDMAHTGRVDGFSAHYKLVSSASLEGLTQVDRSRSDRRRRLIRNNELSSESIPSPVTGVKRQRSVDVQSPSIQLPA